MQRDTGVEEAVAGLVKAMQSGDGTAARDALSRDLTAAIGTDDAEWWSGYDDSAAALAAQLDASGGLPFESGELRGYAEGDLGWFEDHGRIAIDAGPLPVRMTGVLRREEGGWRFLQLHVSVGTPNEDVGMADLPVTRRGSAPGGAA